jgi:hypothetical protein
MRPDLRSSGAARRSTNDFVAGALRRRFRGGTYEAFAHELAWTALRASGAGTFDQQGLAKLVEARFAEQIVEVEQTVERVAARAKAHYLQTWPGDLSGAELAAELAAEDEATQAVSRLHAALIGWARQVVADRSQTPRLFPRLRPLRQRPTGEEAKRSGLVADESNRPRNHFGWW